jgi:hypothetical protein
MLDALGRLWCPGGRRDAQGRRVSMGCWDWCISGMVLPHGKSIFLNVPSERTRSGTKNLPESYNIYLVAMSHIVFVFQLYFSLDRNYQASSSIAHRYSVGFPPLSLH